MRASESSNQAKVMEIQTREHLKPKQTWPKKNHSVACKEMILRTISEKHQTRFKPETSEMTRLLQGAI